MVKLIKANAKKDRAILVVFLMILVFSTFLMQTGLLASHYDNLYDIYTEETGVANCLLFTDASDAQIRDAAETTGNIKEMKTTNVSLISTFQFTTSKNSEKKDGADWLAFRAGDYPAADTLRFVERDDSVKGEKIYLNLFTAYSNHLCVGDEIYMETEYGSYTFTVAGIFQHLMLGNSYTYYAVMLGNDAYDTLAGNSNSDIHTMISVKVEEGTDPDTCLNRFLDALNVNENVVARGYTQAIAKTAYVTILNVIAGFMAAFAIIVILICIIMIVFTIKNNIDRDITNIGALRAVGHTTVQIRMALAGEYLIVGVIGTVIGITLSYLTFPLIDYLFVRELSGLVWDKKFFPGYTAMILAGVILVILGAILFSSRKLKDLHPATALRFGLRANSFRKNHLPLSETRGRLNPLLALKSSLQSMGQNVIIFFIMTAVAFVAMFAVILFYNTKVDISKFQMMLQGDVADAYVALRDTSPEAAHKTMDALQSLDEVSQAYCFSSCDCKVDEYTPLLIYTSTPEYVDCGVYEGEMLREDNEAVLGSSLARELGLGVGDEVEVTVGKNSKRFLITGLQQAVMNERVYVTENAALELGANVVYPQIRIRIKDASYRNVDRALERIKNLPDDNIQNTENYYRFARSNENAPVYGVSMIVLLMIVLCFLTVVLVVRLLMKAMFVRKEKEFGIKKAVGFTSTQLRYQLSLSLLPTTLLASVAGVVLGYFLVNPLLALILGGYGIENGTLIIRPNLTVFTAALVVVLVFVSCYILSRRMKKVSAYRLITE